MNESHDDLREEGQQETPLRQNKAEQQSPGEILREGRIAHDYSVDDLCAQTKLSARTIHALEDNDFGSLSQPVFARGYYRQCAKVLDLNVERVMAAYTAWAGEPAALATSVHVVPYDVTPGGFRMRGLLLLVTVIVLAGLAAIVLLPSLSSNSLSTGDNDNNTTQVLSDRDENSSISNRPDIDSGDSERMGANGGTPDVVGGSGQAQANTGKTPGGRNVNQTLGITAPGQNGSADRDNNASTKEPAVAPSHLQLVFNKRSWVRVTDANGKQMASGIFEAGDTQDFDGTAPYSVKLGFAPGVDVMIGGQKVDVAGQTDSGSVARLTVKAPAGDDNG